LSDSTSLGLTDPDFKEESCQRYGVDWQPEEDLRFNRVFQNFYRLHKAAVPRGDYHIDRIEVFFAVKAPGQVCFVIGGCMEVLANRASEPEHFSAVSYFKIQQVHNHIIDGYIISQTAEKI
jgi:hypothetical protein